MKAAGDMSGGIDLANEVLPYASPAGPRTRERLLWWILFCGVVLLYATILGGLALFVVGPYWKA
jgi:hypothetical protein